MNKKEFMEIASLLRGAYNRAEILKTVQEADAWYECLKDLDSGWVKAAAIQWAMENRFPPTIAELRELAKRNEQQAYEKGEIKCWQ